MSLKSFLRQRAPELYREYLLDMIRQDRPTPTPLLPPDPVPAEVTPMFGRCGTRMTLPTMASLPSDHPAVVYCQGRGLPTAALDHLHFTDQWTQWIAETTWEYTFVEDHAPRLVIPWYDRGGTLLGAQARRIDTTGQAARYVTLKAPTTIDKLYGWDRVEHHRRIYIVEGPLDSWFLPNAVASMDADLLRVYDHYFSSYTAVCAWDNEPRNVSVCRAMKAAIDRGISVVVWPTHLQEKDLNDMAQAGHDVPTLVAQHTYKGLRAELEYLRWHKGV